MEVEIRKSSNGTFEVVSVPAPVFDVETETPLRDDRGVVVYSDVQVLKDNFDSEDEAVEWAEENGHGVV